MMDRVLRWERRPASALEQILSSQPQLPEVSPQNRRKLRIDWIVGGFHLGGGGTRNILRAAHYLERFGHDVALHFTETDLPANKIKYLIRTNFYPFDGEVKCYDGKYRQADAILATHWSTVKLAIAAVPLVREAMYVVQDFEPLFYPMGSDYILAENTYRLGLYCICSGVWCSRLLRRQYGAEADAFGYPIDRTTFHPRGRRKPHQNVIFFARPEMPRRCFAIGVSMLREFHRLMPDVEIITYGSREIETNGLDFPVTNLGMLPTMDDLAQLYSDADAGIAFATTNPSLVPYEMMACGLPVIDIGRPGAELNYGNNFDTVKLANPIPERMAADLQSLLLNPAERQARAERGLELISTLPTDEEMVRQIEALVLNRLARPN